MTIQQISEAHRVRVRRDDCNDEIISGRNGHLYIDVGKPMVYYGDDGREAPLTPKRKGNAIRKLGAGLVRITQNAQTEFIGELAPDAIKPALDILRVRRFKIDKGVSRPFVRIATSGGAGSVESFGGTFQGEIYPPEVERRMAFPKSGLWQKGTEVLSSGLRCDFTCQATSKRRMV
jgi:hypothetical protein